MVKYQSTRGKEKFVLSHEAIIEGLAKDGGLYTPRFLNKKLNPNQLLNDTYQEVAKKILEVFLEDYSSEELKECIEKAYDTKFDTKDIVPVKKIKDGYLMELWHGPTCAFKDIALTLLPYLLTTSYKKENRKDIISILTATSGDTGKAAISGFSDVPHTAITVFYPEIGVSEIQKKQMVTSIGKNVEVIAVKGNFDDCQRMVKEATSNKEVLNSLRNVSISSANSINIGRLVPQIVYYYTSYITLVNEGEIKCGDEVNFVVPTGNFGDILAGYYAKTIGLPVHQLICASNTNHVLTDFLNTGTYSIHRDFIQTISPSMDILISSNLERLLFILSDYDSDFVNQMMKELKEKKEYTIPENIYKKLKTDFSGYWTSEEDTKKTIHDLFEEEHVLIDPHTAVALSAMRNYKKETEDKRPCIVLSTASPYKFSKDVLNSIEKENDLDEFEAMERLSNLSLSEIPANLKNLKNMEVRFTRSIEIKDGMQIIAKRMEELSDED